MNRYSIAAAFVFAALLASSSVAQSASSCDAHHAGVDSRGDHVMGFDHEKTTHHFRLTPNGGVVEVTANGESDTASRDAIRSHLRHIAKMFSEGDFEAPMLIHDRVPPGVPVMRDRKELVAWRYEDIARGGEVIAKTSDPKALAAIHEFLRFQIEDHRTGDSTDVAASRTEK